MVHILTKVNKDLALSILERKESLGVNLME